ncbi:biopolymer transporter ExbD [Tropicibacter sp. R16_0]|uniref:ExbD/TolR family protein n=1 Tax=Tropicibacter sp. R16_0 TaxID=2821102 RepID=UPI001ADA0F3A|nr:biopolymer transporter ExbD [Tropicibacter sp. R16_0]MBO9453493.1 biopolymer transporter ExbD [Tropicibacter sp. R16_0]
MDFSPPKKDSKSEPILPMINVVFLLLVFFLLTAQIAPRAPFDVVPPKVTLKTGSEAAPVLFVSSDGETFFQGETGAEALNAIRAHAQQEISLILRADAHVDATKIVRLLTELRAAGVNKIQLAGQPQ